MQSAVPAGEVMAREDVFGIVRPAAATIGTTSMLDLLLPGMPPMLCLSHMTLPGTLRTRLTEKMCPLVGPGNEFGRSGSLY
jgi:hypothetical protein